MAPAVQNKENALYIVWVWFICLLLGAGIAIVVFAYIFSQPADSEEPLAGLGWAIAWLLTAGLGSALAVFTLLVSFARRRVKHFLFLTNANKAALILTAITVILYGFI